MTHNMKLLPCLQYGTVNIQRQLIQSSCTITSPKYVSLQDFFFKIQKEKGWLPADKQFKNFGCQSLIFSRICNSLQFQALHKYKKTKQNLTMRQLNNYVTNIGIIINIMILTLGLLHLFCVVKHKQHACSH